MKLPPYGKPLAERMKYSNPPLHAVVCIGLDCWARAKAWNTREPMAMVLPPDIAPQALSWPVGGLPVVIEADAGPSEQQISNLALTLLQAGSLPVTCVSPAHPFRQYRWSEK